MRHWTAEVGATNAAWFADPASFAGEQAATDRGDGTVAISAEQMDVLRDYESETGDEPGDTGWDDEYGLYVTLPYDVDGGEGPCEFWLDERHGAVRAG